MIVRRHFVYILACLFAVISLLQISGVSHAQYPGFDAPGGRVSGGGASGLVAVESSIDGGTIAIGATSQVVVLFRNEGGQPVETGQINLYPSSNASANVSLNQCQGAPLPPGAECAVAISVKGLQPGAWRLEMLMLHSGRSRLVTSTLSGHVEANGDSADRLASDIETIPNKIDFGALGSSQTLVESVILRNITSNPINIYDVSINSADSAGFTVDAKCGELKAGQACIATVTWEPKQKGPATGVLVVRHDGAAALASVALSGDYNPDNVDEADIFPEAVPGRGLLVSSQKEVDFGDTVTSASTITVSLVNTGDSELTLNEIKISGSDNGLSLSGNGCSEGLTLQPIEACPLTMTWSPTRIGDVLDDVQIIHSGARGVLILPVRGKALRVVSQDQKAIVLSKAPTRVIESKDVTSETGKPKEQKRKNSYNSQSQNNSSSAINASSALDGLKITSFSAKRAIVNGPGGSRLIHNNRDVMLGGIMWKVAIQENGIEFSNGEDRILLLFDRSLSSVNRVSSQSFNRNGAGGYGSVSGRNGIGGSVNGRSVGGVGGTLGQVGGQIQSGGAYNGSNLSRGY